MAIPLSDLISGKRSIDDLKHPRILPDVFHCTLRYPTPLWELLLANNGIKPEDRPTLFRPFFKDLYTNKDATPWMWLRAALEVFKENHLPYKGSSVITKKLPSVNPFNKNVQRITTTIEYVVEGMDFKNTPREDMNNEEYSFDTIITVRSTDSGSNLFQEVKADRMGFFCMGETTLEEKSKRVDWLEINGIILKIL